MTQRAPRNLAASVQARLVDRSRALGVEHQLTLARFGGERLLYRLAKSVFADQFILKGAVLLPVWLGGAIRPTKDVDLLDLGDTSAEALQQIFVTLCAIEAPEDGLIFLADNVRVSAVRGDQEDGGMRVTLLAMLGNVRIPLRVYVGTGDAVVPPPTVLDFPGLLDLPRARLRAYRPETAIAEKTEAMVRLAMANSRMKDFFDILRLAQTQTFDGETMRLAMTATFSRRQRPIPSELPPALSGEFAKDLLKRVQWMTFVSRTKHPDIEDLSFVVKTLKRFLWPAPVAASRFLSHGRIAARGDSPLLPSPPLPCRSLRRR